MLGAKRLGYRIQLSRVGGKEQHGRRSEKEDGGEVGRGTCRHAPSTCISAVPGQVEHVLGASLGGLAWSNWG